MKVKKTRRAKRNKNKKTKKFLRFLGVNANGLKPRLMTFKKVLSELEPSVFFVEETKYKEEDQLKIDKYVIFELTRDSKDGGGGLAMGVIRELNPILVRKGNDEVEAISVNIFVRSMSIRCVVAYGCQETSHVEKKNAFWKYIEEEAISAKNAGSGFILHFDGNLWAGPQIIPGDPRPQNNNGKLFQQFLDRNKNLSVVNALSVCEGLITRSRLRNGKKEQSILDFFVVCSSVLPYVSRMVIDEHKKYILTNYKQSKYGGKATDSDHFTEYMDINLEIIPEKPKRREIFNFKNKKCQETFKNITTNTTEFTRCFENSLPLEKQIENWRKTLSSFCYTAFKKIRIVDKKTMKPIDKKLAKLVNKRNEMKKTVHSNLVLQEIEKDISKQEAELNRDFIIKNFKKFSSNPENINLVEMWKVLKKMCPKYKKTVPIAKKDFKGKLVTDPKQLKKLLANEYKQRLRTRPTRPDMFDLEDRKNDIFEMQLKIASQASSSPWKLNDLDEALKNLKNNKSRDHAGYANEIFKSGVIGGDLKLSLLKLFNKIKCSGEIPKFMKFANITTIPKKGSLTNLENERGIFRVDVIRSILMRLIYNNKYSVIDKNMSDCQMGSRKKKGCRNNLFIINGIIHDVMRTKKKPVLLQIYDYKQMFDSVDLSKAISDVYEVGMKDDNLKILYEANKEIFMAVNTPYGETDRETIRNSVLQGETWSSLLASVQVDSIGQECERLEYGYKYKDSLHIGLLGLVDDTIAITEVGYKAHIMNAFLNVKTAEKRLQFNENKCKTMLVGEDCKKVLNSNLSVDRWVVEHIENKHTGETEIKETFFGQVEVEKCTEQRYLGFLLSNSGNNMKNISAVKRKSIGTIKQIFSKLETLNFGKYFFEVGLILKNAILRTSILYASETYYNLKEAEIRQIERIEENFMRKLLKTSKGCPIIQIYLELGQIPARYEIIKLRLFFLRYILNQDPDSKLYRFFNLQIEKPVRFDWASTCKQDLKKLDINLSFEDIRSMSVNKFRKLIQNKCKEKALEYLMRKRGSKGKEIQYTDIETAEYLLPNNDLNIEDQRMIFAIRNRMIDIPSNFISKERNNAKCICSKIEEMKHIYECEYLNEKKPDIQYEAIFNGTITEQKKVLKRFRNSIQSRDRYKETNHVILHCDPLPPVTIGA